MDRQVYERMRDLEESHWWFSARRAILSDQIGRLGLCDRAKVLEVGCGTGGNLKMLSRFGAVTGLEPDDEARAYAAEKGGAPIVAGGLPDGIGLGRRRFDMVAALDVIEHVDRDGEAIGAMARMLKPGGFLVTTVPAYGWMWSRHDDLHHHKRRYRLGEFRALFEKAGLKVRKASYFNTLLFAPIAAVRIVKSLLRRGGADEDRMPAGAVNGVLKGLFGLERFWLRRGGFPFGVSILVIAERPA
ncbi:MAG TPA: class I SAM-dependent methyltransferase [Caulobacteraceae bacterium]|nr:class I SAM-dependent methyltransferase [Caulobacteraceae bacterium]